MLYYIIQLIFGVLIGLFAILFRKKFIRLQKDAALKRKWFVNRIIGKKIIETPSNRLERNAVFVGILFIVLSVVNFI